MAQFVGNYGSSGSTLIMRLDAEETTREIALRYDVSHATIARLNKITSVLKAGG